MAKRIKMPTIKPEKRQEWLRRSEKGETAPQIAETDDVDVRTVRKHLNLARMEIDVQQARSIVLKEALEGHYRDLIDTVRSVQSQITAESPVSMEKDFPLILGLKQHMPRSPLWENLRKWNRTLADIAELEAKTPSDIQKKVEGDDRLKKIPSQGGNGVITATIDALVHQVKQWSRGAEGLKLERDYHEEKTGENTISLRYGFSHFGEIDREYIEVIKSTIKEHETNMKKSEDYLGLENLVGRQSRLAYNIRDIITTILLRRIVPGKCKYCPL
jgi:hypothetical protein